MSNNLIRRTFPLAMHWETQDPFLFCAHHRDLYPAGDERMGPKASLAGRNIGSDFSVKDGWSMYHGDVVPGFPSHPHRGFETISIMRDGYIDHADSLGAAARFGKGDVQWMTAGKGIVHSEMFPLVNTEEPNPTELFQVWLNLPPESKMVDPDFTMYWAHEVPEVSYQDEQGRTTEIRIVAGGIAGMLAKDPPPRSWAARPDSRVGVWTIKMAPGAQWELPPAQPGMSRSLYNFKGSDMRLNGESLPARTGAFVTPDQAVLMEAGVEGTEILLLEGRPIGAPVAAQGPFVLNTREELAQAFADYRRTGFGNWPWPNDAFSHPRERGRFAILMDGSEVTPEG